MGGIICQRKRGDHEDDRCGRCHFAQKGRCAGAAEKGLAGAAAKGCAHVGALAGLQQHDHDQRKADDYVYDNECLCHKCYRLWVLFFKIEQSC